ncbi:MAG: hypothetical protein ACKVU4_05030 [Phycisphaerales bacterium]
MNLRPLLLLSIVSPSAAWLALTAGCAAPPSPPLKGPGGPGTATPYPFAPARIEVHPLTRLTRDAQQRPMILCHVEFRDAWGDTCKSVGQLLVLLYRGAPGEPVGVQELRWDVDLTDLQRNMSFFDAATRTYRFQLHDVPEWALTESSPISRVRIRAALTTIDAKGRPFTLEDEFVVP